MAYIGVDIGGTFTDLVCLLDDGSVRIDKVPSSSEPTDLVEAIARFGVLADDLAFLGLGTTVGTNALIERKGARTALITTRGFRDVLELRRTNAGDLYDLQWDPPAPLVPRADRLEITERMDWHGNVLTPLDEHDVARLVRIVRKRGIEAVAIVFLHSYVNGDHERQLRDLLAAEVPELEISISCEVLPMYREFERTATVAANAYLAPVMRRYFEDLRACIAATGFDREIQVMQSNGGLASMRSAAETPAKLVRSGPSAGSVALEELSRQLAEPNIIGLDIGGTSADVPIVWEGRAKLSDRVTPEWGLPVVLPSLDIISIGAGGGSIARIDAGGSLVVGPESAGSQPGPACYMRGGTLPTSTDAQVVLGRLGTELVGGDYEIDPALAAWAIREHVAEPLGLDVHAAAEGILRILADNMMRAVRIVTIERGYDPRDFVLCGFGGSGPMYAVDIARGLSVPRVVVPRFPGVLSAYGVLRSDMVYDATRTVLSEVEAATAELAEQEVGRLEQIVLDRFADDEVSSEDIRFRRRADLRYTHQMHETAVDVPDGPFDAAALETVVAAFHSEHHRTYGHSEPSDPVTLVNLRVLGQKPHAARAAMQAAEPVPVGDTITRRVHFGTDGWVETALVPRETLAVGDRVAGPALITQRDTTTVLPPGSAATVHATGDLVVDVEV